MFSLKPLNLVERKPTLPRGQATCEDFIFGKFIAKIFNFLRHTRIPSSSAVLLGAAFAVVQTSAWLSYEGITIDMPTS